MSTTSDNTTTGSRTTLGQYLGLLGRYLRPQRRMVALMAVLLMATIGLQLLIPQVLRTFIDVAVGDAEVVALGRMALLFLAIALLNQLFGAGATYAGADVGWRATNAMRAELMRHCLRLDMRFHTAHTAGEMIERIDGDVTALSDFFSQFSVRVLGGMLLLGGILVLLWLENPWIGLALTGFTALQLLVLLRLRSLGVPATKLERENSAQLFGFIEERLAGIEDLRANGGGPHAMHRFGAVIRTFFFGTRRAWLLQSVVWLSSFGLFIVGIGVTLGASIALMTRGIITIGTGYMVFQYMLMLQNPVEQISRQLQELQKAAASIGRVQQLFAERSTLPAGRGRPLPAGALGVVFDAVSFAYHPGTPILQGIDLRLAPGQVLGLLGRTGSGKTSLTRLLFRLYDVDEGSVRLGGCRHPRRRPRSAARPRRPGHPGGAAVPGQRARQPHLLRPCGRRCAVALRARGAGHGRLARFAAQRPRRRAHRRRWQPLGRRGATAGLRPGVPQGSRPGDSRRALVAPRPRDRAAAGTGPDAPVAGPDRHHRGPSP